jgi:hypothetical protein
MQSAPKSETGYSILYHMRSAVKWRGLTWEYFCELDEQAQAGYVAEYETAMRLGALEAEAQRKAMKRRQRQAKAAAQLRSARRRY